MWTTGLIVASSDDMDIAAVTEGNRAIMSTRSARPIGK